MNKGGIPDAVLDRIRPGGDFSGPGVETGPVLNALMGDSHLMKRVLEVVPEHEGHGKDIPIQQHSVITLNRYGKDPSEQEPIAFSAKKTSYLHYPDAGAIEKLHANGKVSNYHYTKANNSEKRSIIELGKEGITEHSTRALLVEQIHDRFFTEEKKTGYQHDFRKKVHANTYRIGSFGANEALANENISEIFKENKLKKKGFLQSGKKNNQYGQSSSYELLNNIEKVMADSDAILLFPDMLEHKKKNSTAAEGEKEKLAELMKLYTLFSLEVNKQLNARDAEKPIILLNHDGSWDNAIAIHNNLANLGMTKEYSISLPAQLSDKHSKVQIQSNGYYDVLGTPRNGGNVSYQETVDAALQLLKNKRKGYIPRKASTSDEREIGIAPKDFNGFKVALFCSAGNENKYLNEAVKNISYNLAKDEFGIIYGGGDRYTMGAVLEGVTKYRKELMHSNGTPGLSAEEAKKKTYIAGYSTKHILKAETSRNDFSPELNYSKQNIDIYQRMDDMLKNSDAVIAAPGGAGTVQEWVAALILNHSRPKEEKKPIVFYNPELNHEKIQVWNVALKAVLGKNDYDLLTGTGLSRLKDRERRFDELGIYIETTEKGMQNRISELRAKHENKKETSFVEKYHMEKLTEPNPSLFLR